MFKSIAILCHVVGSSVAMTMRQNYHNYYCYLLSLFSVAAIDDAGLVVEIQL